MPRTSASARFLTAVEEHDLIVRAQAGDMTARDRVIAGFMPFIHLHANKIATRYPPADPEDLAQEGVLKIVAKFNHFNPALGFRFSTYFGRAVQRTMLVAAQENGVVRSISGRSALKETTRAAQRRHSGPLLSLNNPTLDDGHECMMIDLLLDMREGAAEEAHLETVAQVVSECIERLPERWRQIIDWRFREGRTLAEIGAIRGLTRERIRQIIREGLPWAKQILFSEEIIREFVAEHGLERPG